MPHISASQFKERFVTFVMRAKTLPKDPTDQHVLLISAALQLDPARRYNEREINAELDKWSTRFGEKMNLDAVSLRRMLVDERYLQRDAAGRVYELASAEWPYTFDPAIQTFDLDELLSEAWSERAAKRQQYQAGQTT